MAFQGVSRDIFDSWNEVGLVYTRNKYGRVSAPSGYKITDKNDCSYKISLFKGASCSVAKDGNNFNPQSLFLICLDFVAKNITMVESLAEFPDIVGKELFHKVQENEGFASNAKNLKLFCEAYGELVLSKLSLSSKHILANNYLEFLQFFTFLTEMDVSHCRLGDNHELLSYMSHFHWLIKLSLKDNCLSDTGVKKFTLPKRLLKDGLGKLAVLDLASNHDITDNAVKHLLKLTSLTALNLSGTQVSFRYGVPQLLKHRNLCLAPQDFNDEFNTGKAFTVTEGWAVDVINDWLKKSKCLVASRKRNPLEVRRGTFYKSTRSEIIQKLTEKRKNHRACELPVIMFTSKIKKRNWLQSNTKNCLEDHKQDVAMDGQPSKKLKMSSDNADAFGTESEDALEDELFKEYLVFNSSNVCKPLKKQCSLLESMDCLNN
ncbi:unnamed protein product [Porites evermanni]|uniref:Leucine-rich repeat-containing protein 42 n=1 Tax=Porites evermanni TaxID=104178 RepID=A0ABN8M4M0_9CNID|nr:unnamed protein product [Porites evermanni]